MGNYSVDDYRLKVVRASLVEDAFVPVAMAMLGPGMKFDDDEDCYFDCSFQG